MSDDLERRLRQAFLDAPLPGAPSTLRSALQGMPDAVPVRGTASRWQRLPLALAAVLVLAVAGLAGFGVLSKLPFGPVGPSGTGLATEPPAPPTSVQVLDATQLAAAIAAQRAGGLAPQVVVTSVSIDGKHTPGPSPRECAQPIGPCVVVGVLAGMADPDGTVTIRLPGDGSGDLPTPTTPADLAGPVALRLAGTAPIEFLGHVDLQGATGQVDVPALLAATATAPDGRVRAVDGWLVGISTPSCGPYIPVPQPAPFACPSSRSLLSATPVKPIVPLGSIGFSAAVPDDAVPVQAFAYGGFAPSPANDGLNDVPRHGLYLVRMVAVDTAECPACRGWLIVGRLDAAATPAPTPSGASSAPATGAMDVITAAQAADMLARDRASFVGRPLLIDGTLALDQGLSCAVTDAWCVLGHLDGTTVPVYATGYTNALLPPDDGYLLQTVMAFVVRETGLEYLGYMGYHNGVSFEHPISSLTDLTQQPLGPMVVAVRGWLVAGLPIPCPMPLPGTPPNTPFEGCPPAWLTQDEVQPVEGTIGAHAIHEPDAAIHVQYGAYGDFAPHPVSTADGLTQPRYGTYLVRLVTDTSHRDATAARGWQVVGRLDPAPVVGPPLSAPLPSIPPVVLPTPRADIVTTCLAEATPSASAAGGDPCPGAIDTSLAALGYASTARVTRLYLQPGIFPCGMHWGEPTTCLGLIWTAGSRMYGWAAFEGTNQVAAIQLWRTPLSDVMPNPAWQASAVSLEVPPASWSMP